MNASLKFFVILAILLALFPNHSGPVQSSVPINPNTTAAPTNFPIYLPVILRGSLTPPTSITLIEQAVARGEISAEQGLIYKSFAVWGDPRLPVQYIGAADENAGDRVMREIAEQSAALSDAARLTLSPFFLPPTDPESWWQMQNPAVAKQPAPAGSWQSLSAAGGKIKV